MDFGQAVVVVDGVEQKGHLFAMDLPQSDAPFVMIFPQETTEAFCQGHVEAFAFFGGVPQSILYDNTSIAVARILSDGERVRTQTFSQLLSHYPTLLSLMGMGQAIPASVTGSDLSRQVRDGTEPYPTSALYQLMPHDDPAGGRRGVITNGHVLVLDLAPDRAPVLHDQRADPYQMRNLAADRPDLVRRLVDDELIPWLRRTDDPWLGRAREAGLIPA